MQKILVTLATEGFSPDQIRSLEQVLLRHYNTYITKQKAKVWWNMVPQGDGFKNNQEKQPVIITMGCPVGFAQHKRLSLFKSIEEDWVAIGKCNPDHMVIGILEQPVFDAFFKRSTQQLSFLGKLTCYAKLLFRISYSKLNKGYTAFNPSL